MKKNQQKIFYNYSDNKKYFLIFASDIDIKQLFNTVRNVCHYC